MASGKTTFLSNKVVDKCKARLVVRKDQQLKTVIGNTYAATLAVRSLRNLIATVARFDLELIQYDEMNAFVDEISHPCQLR